ncbi:MAG: hypothetical protein Q7R75_02135 [bacterium]|nr:hypothetical protein [bacterium]
MKSLSIYKTKWTKVSQLKAGMKIAVRDPKISGGAIWDEIVSIQSKGRERVYDIEVEGTHNFVGNDIVAHNTYINGNLGLSTTTPEYKLVVGDGISDASAQIPRGGLCVDDDGWCDPSTPGRISAVSYITGASDLAENYHSSEPLEPGDIVAAAGKDNVAKADNARGAIIGIVSTRPGMILGSDNGMSNDGQYPVALVGRVPVKVDLEAGEIKAGDRISLSNILGGVGKKATSSEEYVGIALEEFNYDSKEDYTANVPNNFNVSSTTNIWDGAFMRQVQENQIKVKKILVFAKLGQKKLALEDEPIIKNHEARITESENKIASLDLRVKNLENIIASSTQAGLIAGGQVGLSTGTDNPQAGQADKLVVSEGMNWVLSQFRQIGIYIAQGVIQAREFIAEKITARKVVTDFIEMKDSATDETWCVRIANGEWDKFKGTCGEASVSSAQSAAVAEPILTPVTEPTPASAEQPVVSTNSGQATTTESASSPQATPLDSISSTSSPQATSTVLESTTQEPTLDVEELQTPSIEITSESIPVSIEQPATTTQL